MVRLCRNTSFSNVQSDLLFICQLGHMSRMQHSDWFVIAVVYIQISDFGTSHYKFLLFIYSFTQVKYVHQTFLFRVGGLLPVGHS